MEDKTDRKGIQVIERAADILRALEGERDGMSLSEIANEIGLPRSTVQRIVGALLTENLLMPASANARVKLGPVIARLGAAANIDIVEFVRPVMAEIAEAVDETVDFSFLRGHAAVFREQIPSRHRLAAISAVGEAFPLHCTANGKALLAALPRKSRAALLGGSLPRLTASTIVSPSKLLEELEKIAESHLAWDNEEHQDGISACGIAFLDASGMALALSVPAPTSRFTKKREKIQQALLKARAELVGKFQ